MEDFKVLYERYFQDVYLYVYALARNQTLAEDITAETFEKALSRLHTFRGQADFRVWLCQIAKNTFLSHCRKHRRLVPLPDHPIESPVYFEEQMEDKDLAIRINRFIQTMKEPYRQVFILRVYYGLPYRKIAETLGHTESWARVTYTRAKSMIQKWIQEVSYE